MFLLHHKRAVVIVVRRADFVAIGFAFLEILDMNLMGIESELHAAARAFSIWDIAIGEGNGSVGLGDEFLSDAVNEFGIREICLLSFIRFHKIKLSLFDGVIGEPREATGIDTVIVSKVESLWILANVIGQIIPVKFRTDDVVGLLF